jgi:hypothetical protein
MENQCYQDRWQRILKIDSIVAVWRNANMIPDPWRLSGSMKEQESEFRTDESVSKTTVIRAVLICLTSLLTFT